MAVKSSGTISFSEIATEFIVDGSALSANYPFGLGQYYRSRGPVPDFPENSNIPAWPNTTNTEIKFSDFYDAVVSNQREINITSSDISNGSVNLFTKAQQKSGDTVVNGELQNPFVITIKSGVTVYNTCYIGGNFANLTIIIESGVKMWGRGANGGSSSNQPAIDVNTSTGALTIINNGWLASGGTGGSTRSDASSTGVQEYGGGETGNITITCTGGGGGGQGGGSGAASTAVASGALSRYRSSNGGSGDQDGGNGRSSSTASGAEGNNDRISRGTASGGVGRSGGGQGGGSTACVQNNEAKNFGFEYSVKGGGGGGSNQTPSSGSSGSATSSSLDFGTDKALPAGARDTGTGGGSWGTGSKEAIYRTNNASSYTLTNNGTIYGT